MYEHILNKTHFNNYRYYLKTDKNGRSDFSGCTIFEKKKLLEYLKSLRECFKKHAENFSEFDFSEESEKYLNSLIEENFNKYFKIIEYRGIFIKIVLI